MNPGLSTQSQIGNIAGFAGVLSLSQESSLSSESYAYDEAGTLTEVQETPVGKGCMTRLYGYDEDGDRTSLTTREPAAGGGCATEGGSVEGHSYDTASGVVAMGETSGGLSAVGEGPGVPGVDVFDAPVVVACGAYGTYKAVEAIVKAL